MATYSFSALADGQAIGFFPASDLLLFDESIISGADIRVSAEGSNTRVTVVSGSLAGKDVLLQNTTPLQLATSNVSFANGSALLFGDNAVAQNDDAANTLIGTTGSDLLQGFGGNDFMQADAGNDVVLGGAGNDTVGGNAGDDSLEGGSGNDTVAGGGGRDIVMFREFGAANADSLTDFASTWDALHLDAGAFTQIGAAGRFASGDVRFWSAAGAASGHDADDRIIFNTTTRQIFYDADGSGPGAAQLIATLQAGGTVVATDITVEAAAAPPPSGGMHITGGFLSDSLVGGEGNDTIEGGPGSDTLVGLGGDDLLTDTTTEITNPTHDSLVGGAGNDTLYGGIQNDRLIGGTGNDELEGGAHFDQYVFDVAPGAANADVIIGFQAGIDKIHLDANAFAAIGGSGIFATNDPRFHAAAGASGGHDADDRVVLDTTSGRLWYDADGSGAAAAQLIATLSGAPAFAATDVFVENGTSEGQALNGTAGNDSITGTEGPDTIHGLAGNDTLNGLAGNDSLDGGTGDDSLVGSEGVDLLLGGDGNDTLDGQSSFFGDTDSDVETLDGGLGNDLYWVDNPADVVSDAGGVDTVVAVNMNYTLPAGFENLTLDNGEFESRRDGIGNDLNNVLGGLGRGWFVYYEGRGGNDTIFGSPQNDTLLGGDGNDSLDGGEDFDILDGGLGDDTLYGGAFSDFDTLTGGGGADHFVLDDIGREFITDFASGADKIRLDGNLLSSVGASGNYSAADERFFAGAGVTAAHDATDRFIYNTTTGDAYYDDDGTGSAAPILIATLQSIPALAATDIEVINGSAPPPAGGINGTEGNDSLVGTLGNDTINGLGGNDTLWGDAGNDTVLGGTGNDTVGGNAGDDWVEGGAGNDRVSGGGGRDSFVFRETPGAANADNLTDFSGNNWDRLLLDNAVMAALGGDGRFVSGDARFWGAAGANTGHDANDRVVYNTSTGQLYYDADGSGAGGAQLIATLQAGATIVAADITVI